MPLARFQKKFDAFDVAAAGLAGYPAAYAKHLLTHLSYYAAIYEQMIVQALKAANKPAASLTVLDFGCGNGLLGLFAKEYGFKKVWLCDRSGEFLAAAKRTADKTGIAPDGFIEGEMEAVNDFFVQRGERPDLLLASDVIEHLYDLNGFLHQLQLLNPNLISVFTTASNPLNPVKTRSLHKLQYRDEWIGYAGLTEEERTANGLATLSFLDQRKEILRQQFPQLSEPQVEQLALQTRGRSLNDINNAVQQYMNGGGLPAPPDDPYWVCDPYTGSWTERILPFGTYKNWFHRQGYALRLVNGFYNAGTSGFFKKATAACINWLINFLPKAGRYAAPYVVLIAVPFKQENGK